MYVANTVYSVFMYTYGIIKQEMEVKLVKRFQRNLSFHLQKY